MIETEKVKDPRLPKHRIIEEELLSKIKGGLIPVGHQIPTENSLSLNYGVSRLTAQKAVMSLASKGFVERTPGRGTFVTEWRREQNRRNIARKDIAVLFVGVDSSRTFYLNLLNGASRTAEQFGLHVTFAGVTDYELSKGQVPLAIREGTACGSLIVGPVTECHIKNLLGYKIPCLLVGSHPDIAGQPRITVDYEDMAYQLTSRLLELKRGPAWLVTESFRLYCTREIYNGYQRAVFAHPDPVLLLNTCQSYECSPMVVERMLATKQEHFCVLVWHEQAEGLLASIKLKGISSDRVTVIVVGQRGNWCTYENGNVMFCEINGSEFGEEGVKQMVAACEGRSSLASKAFKLVIEETGDSLKPFRFSWT